MEAEVGDGDPRRSSGVPLVRRSDLAARLPVWAGLFIQHTSVGAFDGRRYTLFDDAMISMRYGWNLSHNGLCESGSAEGYTNLLMTLIMAVSTGSSPSPTRFGHRDLRRTAMVAISLTCGWIALELERPHGP
jgi:hypothetical protein